MFNFVCFMTTIFFKALDLSAICRSNTFAVNCMVGELLSLGVFRWVDSSFRFNSHYLGVTVPKKNLSRFLAKVVNSRLFLCSSVDGDLYFTYTIS